LHGQDQHGGDHGVGTAKDEEIEGDLEPEGNHLIIRQAERDRRRREDGSDSRNGDGRSERRQEREGAALNAGDGQELAAGGASHGIGDERNGGAVSGNGSRAGRRECRRRRGAPSGGGAASGGGNAPSGAAASGAVGIWRSTGELGLCVCVWVGWGGGHGGRGEGRAEQNRLGGGARRQKTGARRPCGIGRAPGRRSRGGR
ncbi:hypothetical protein PVAP13_9KG021020, partial [Panicum virgatum]